VRSSKIRDEKSPATPLADRMGRLIRIKAKPIYEYKNRCDYAALTRIIRPKAFHQSVRRGKSAGGIRTAMWFVTCANQLGLMGTIVRQPADERRGRLSDARVSSAVLENSHNDFERQQA
jgi:hypothetical protein